MNFRMLSEKQITQAVKELFLQCPRILPQDALDALKKAEETEESPVGKSVLKQIIENSHIALAENLALCQDTGTATLFVQWGQGVLFSGSSLTDAINEGVRQAYKEGYYRNSIVNDPLFDRKNTGDNTPCIIHFEMIPGDKVIITASAKGGGSENMGAVRMLKPAEGIEGVKKFVVDTVSNAGGNPCPPIVVGVGIGGSMDKAALLSKKALNRTIGQYNPDERYKELEIELLRLINNTGIGPMGFGGRVTALAVHVEFYPCHIASLPVAVSLLCHSIRHKEVIL